MENDMSLVPKRTFRGIIFMTIGGVILLHTLGIFEQWLSALIVIFAAYMIFYGAMMAQVPHHFAEWIRKMRKKA